MKYLTLLLLTALPSLSNAQSKTCWDLVDSLKRENEALKALLVKNGLALPKTDTAIYNQVNTGTPSYNITSVSPAKSATQTSHQCSGRTKKGTRCSRMVVNGNNCWQHGG